MPTRPLALVLAVVCLAPLAAAEERKPDAAFAAAVAAFPAPAAAQGFTWRGVMRSQGIGIGKVLLSAEPATLPNGKPGWKLVEQYLPNGLTDRKAVAWVGPDLAPVRGELAEKRPGITPYTARWERTDAGFRIEKITETKGETAKESRVVEHQGGALTTMTGLWLFGRLATAEEGRFETTIFEPAPNAGSQVLEIGRWTFEGRGAWRGGQARLLRGQKGKNLIAAGFDLKTRAFLGCDFLDEKGDVTLSFEATADEEEETPKPESGFEAPGKTAEGAALTAAFALATGDVDLVARIFHWPTFHADEKKAYDMKTADDAEAKPFPDVESFRKQVLARFEKTLVKRNPGMVQMGMRMASNQLQTETLESGRRRIQFPEMFRSMLLEVAEIDGAWYLVRIPPLPAK